jgi:hypothetical protein
MEKRYPQIAATAQRGLPKTVRKLPETMAGVI